jgi:hypothetical protein
MSGHGTQPGTNGRIPQSDGAAMARAIADYLSGALRKLSEELINEANRTGLPGAESGPADLYRHCTLAGELRLRYGERTANTILNANEVKGAILGPGSILSGAQAFQNSRAATRMDKLVNDRCLAAMAEAESPEDVRRIATEKTRQAIRNQGTGRNGSLPYLPPSMWNPPGRTQIPPQWGGGNPNNPHRGFEPAMVDAILERPPESWTEQEARLVISDPRYYDSRRRDPRVVQRVQESYERRYGGPNGGPIQIDSYTRGDGTHVDSHTRSAPKR